MPPTTGSSNWWTKGSDVKVAPLTLALLEAAPDRQTAKIMLVEALSQGIDPDLMRTSWERWESFHRDEILRGETA